MDETTQERERDNFRDNKLYKLLLEKLPSEYVTKFGRLDTERLRTATGNARFTIYRWFHQQRLSPKAAKTLLKLSRTTKEIEKKGALTREDLIPFVVGV